MPRQVYRHSETKRLYVERNFKPGSFYQIEMEDGELVHPNQRNYPEHDVTSDKLVPVEVKRTGVEQYV